MDYEDGANVHVAATKAGVYASGGVRHSGAWIASVFVSWEELMAAKAELQTADKTETAIRKTKVS